MLYNCVLDVIIILRLAKTFIADLIDEGNTTLPGILTQ